MQRFWNWCKNDQASQYDGWHEEPVGRDGEVDEKKNQSSTSAFSSSLSSPILCLLYLIGHAYDTYDIDMCTITNSLYFYTWTLNAWPLLSLAVNQWWPHHVVFITSWNLSCGTLTDFFRWFLTYFKPSSKWSIVNKINKNKLVVDCTENW